VCDKGVAEELVVMLAPFVPHFAEEAWERLGHAEPVFEASWPAWDEGLVVEDRVEVVVQVNGKTRSKVQVPRDADEETVVAAALREATIGRFVEGKGVRKRIYVANRLLNFVVG
jgi:leucyl-tRNA synthetase